MNSQTVAERNADRSNSTQMLATHESMRLPRLSEGGFSFWRAIELTACEPLFLLTVAYQRPAGELDMLFSLDQEVVSFLTDQTTATPTALQVLVPRGWSGSVGWRILPVSRIEIRQTLDSADPLSVLCLADGQTVRGRDLAPVEGADASAITIAEFPGSAAA